jgi:choline dehydrogenase-like flavoprotein
MAALVELQLRFLGSPGAPVADNPRAITADALRLLDVVPEILRGLLFLIVDELGGAEANGLRFAQLAPPQREQLLFSLWANPDRRAKLAQIVRVLWLVIHSRPPARAAVGFQPMTGANPEVPLGPPAPLDRAYDTCVIGSGAGGAVVAARAAQAGRDVLLLDEGPWIDPHGFPVRDDQALMDCYRNAGLQVALPDVASALRPGGLATMLILQARVFGGGPAINNAIHLPMPEQRWSLWRKKHDFPIEWPALVQAYQRVSTDLGVVPSTQSGGPGPRAEVFRLGAERAGWPVEALPVSVLHCIGCGGCNTGCRFGLKTGGLHGKRAGGEPISYLERARQAGVHCRPSLRITRLHGSGDGTRVSMVTGEDLANGGRKVEIRAKNFVLAAGPIASSKILIKSGIGIPTGHPTGRGISGNVVLPVLALLAEDKLGAPDPGLQMCYVVEREGLLLESWFHYPGSLGLAISQRPDAHGQLLRQYKRLTACGVVVPSDPHGSLGMTWDPVFTVNAAELERLCRGALDAAKLFFAAGAVEVMPAVQQPLSIRRDHQAEDEQAFLRQVKGPADLMLSTAHPQGGNSIGRRERKSVVGPDFRPHGIKGLQVADASLFPAGCGVNPQMTVMALAHLAADRLLAST